MSRWVRDLDYPYRDSPPLHACTFTPVPRWEEAVEYGGSGIGNSGGIFTEAIACHGGSHRLRLVALPLGLVGLPSALA